MADDTSEALKIWEAIRPMIDTEIAEKTRSCVRTRKMVCTTAPNGSVIGVAEPFGNEVKIPYSSSVSNAQVGDAVWVQWYYDNASTMLAISFGDGSSQEYLPLTGGTVTGSITSTREGLGFYSRAASGAVGFSATNTTSGQGVSVLVGTSGTNRGLYDNTSDKWMAYCDGNDALRFAGVTSATKGDLGIDELEDSIGSMKTTAKTLSANSPTTFTFSGFCGVAILIEGANTSLMCILLVHCSGTGNITVSKIGTASNITTSTATNKLTITNGASSTAAYARVIRITSTGAMPT